MVAAGVVRSVKETLNSQFVENCKGVIERLTLKEEKMVWNRTTHIWYGITAAEPQCSFMSSMFIRVLF